MAAAFRAWARHPDACASFIHVAALDHDLTIAATLGALLDSRGASAGSVQTLARFGQRIVTP